ncbi:heme-binding protein [Sphingomonas sp.]|uniref:GlcG/HbpS family heme-binding protein n=1 Tax=Sphingomonas sp. TaxID=28214 RepID=UPI00286AB4D0|nr:heme-binding protein [Sphingomonas sp.]
MRIAVLAGALALMVGTPAQAQQTMLDARTAQAIVAGCAAHATTKKQSHAIAVVDVGGHLIAALKMDRSSSGAMDFSIEKAVAVAAWGFPTAGMEEAATGTPGFARAPNVVTVAGGVPVWSTDGRTRLGGVGASGEDPKDDAACAEAGIRASGLRTARAT